MNVRRIHQNVLKKRRLGIAKQGDQTGGAKIKTAASQSICPIRGPFAVDTATLPSCGLAAAKLFNVGVPFYDVSFRAFTASSTIEKGTPTDQ